MFTSSDLIVSLLVGIGFGLVAGVVATVILIADPLRRKVEFLRANALQWQMRTYASDSRLAAHRMLRDSEADTFSRKVPDLKAVQ